MLHYIKGKVKTYGDQIIIQNDFFGIEVFYKGLKKSGEFFLYPYFEQNANTYRYLAFETFSQKKLFSKLRGVPGIGPKTAHSIAMKGLEDVRAALEENDMDFFKSIKGIGSKTAKRIIVDLQGSFDSSDFQEMAGKENIYNSIIDTLRPLGYDKTSIKNEIKNIDIPLEKSNMQKIIQKLINQL